MMRFARFGSRRLESPMSGLDVDCESNAKASSPPCEFVEWREFFEQTSRLCLGVEGALGVLEGDKEIEGTLVLVDV